MHIICRRLGIPQSFWCLLSPFLWPLLAFPLGPLEGSILGPHARRHTRPSLPMIYHYYFPLYTTSFNYLQLFVSSPATIRN